MEAVAEGFLLFLMDIAAININKMGFLEQAKPETVQKVCDIVKKQLALAEDTTITGESKFSALGADSLDTVFILAVIFYYL